MPPGARLEIEPCGEDWNGGCTQAAFGESSCCHPNCGTWFCDNYICFNAVGAVDPFCYCVCWDYICAQEAALLCPDLCTLAAIAFEPIACGEVVYGSLWSTNENGEADTDWYELTLDAPALVEVTLAPGVQATFGIAETDGVPDCAIATQLDPAATVPSCGTATVSRCLEAGCIGSRWLRPFTR